jgi:hypothetical protein
MSAYLQRDVRLWRAYSSTSSQSAVGSRTIRVHHLREAACLIGSDLHTMHHQKFRKSVSCLFGSWGLRAPGRVSVPAPSARTCTVGTSTSISYIRAHRRLRSSDSERFGFGTRSSSMGVVPPTALKRLGYVVWLLCWLVSYYK